MGKDPSWRPHLMVTASSMPSPKPYMEMRPWHFLWSWVQSYQLQSVINQICKITFYLFMICMTSLCPRHKMARGHLVFALSVIPSFCHSVIPSFRRIKVCLLNSSYILAWIWMKLGRDVAPQSRSACGEIIHVRQILAVLWSLTLRIFTYFSLSSQLLQHPCLDLNETWQGCCTTSLEMHVGR